MYVCVCVYIKYMEGFLVAQLVKNPPTMQESQVQSLGWEDPLEKEMTTYSSILQYSCLENSLDRSLDGGLQFMESQRVRHNLATKPPPPPYIIYTKCHFSCIPMYVQTSPNACTLIGSNVEPERWPDALPLAARLLPCDRLSHSRAPLR